MVQRYKIFLVVWIVIFGLMVNGCGLTQNKPTRPYPSRLKTTQKSPMNKSKNESKSGMKSEKSGTGSESGQQSGTESGER